VYKFAAPLASHNILKSYVLDCGMWVSRSPVTLPGYRAGQTPDNAGRTLPPEIVSPDKAYLRHIAPVELVETISRRRWNSP